MKKTIYVLSVITFLLIVWATTLWLPTLTARHVEEAETRYGLNEGLELVEQANGKEGKRYVVEDADGKVRFLKQRIAEIRFCHKLISARWRKAILSTRK